MSTQCRHYLCRFQDLETQIFDSGFVYSDGLAFLSLLFLELSDKLSGKLSDRVLLIVDSGAAGAVSQIVVCDGRQAHRRRESSRFHASSLVLRIRPREAGHPAGIRPPHRRDRRHHDASRHGLVPQLDRGAAPGMAPHGAPREATSLWR